MYLRMNYVIVISQTLITVDQTIQSKHLIGLWGGSKSNWFLVPVNWIDWERMTDRWTHRELDKETVTDRYCDWLTEKAGTDALTDRWTDRQTQWLIDKRQTVTEAETDRQTDTHRDWQSETDRWKNTAAVT